MFDKRLHGLLSENHILDSLNPFELRAGFSTALSSSASASWLSLEATTFLSSSFVSVGVSGHADDEDEGPNRDSTTGNTTRPVKGLFLGTGS